MASVSVLHHAPRSGKTLVALAAARYGSSLQGIRFREHQVEAVQYLESRGSIVKPEEDPSIVVWVCSSLVVAQQLVDDFISKLDAVLDYRIVCSCTEEQYSAFVTASESDIQKFLSTTSRQCRSRQLLLVTSYQSVYKIHNALQVTEKVASLLVLDEAHNVHTPSRWFLWGAQNEHDKEPSGQGIEALNRQYPRRLYLTGTPSDAMYKWPAVYGDSSSDWHRCSYADLIRIQDPLEPYVKEFDLRVVINGRPFDATQSAEFFDCVSVLREATSDPSIRRVKMYHRRAHRWKNSGQDEDDDDESTSTSDESSDDKAEEEVRSAEFFAQRDLWLQALDYLRSRHETAMPDDDLVISQVRGDMSQKTIREELNAFNSDCSKLRILCSCQVLREGVTLERCDMTVYADGKRSHRDIIQSSMRGLKAEKGHPEKRLRILLLVNLDHLRLEAASGSVEEVSETIIDALRSRDAKMETTALVIEALKDEDEDFGEYIKALSQKKGETTEIRETSECRGDRRSITNSNGRFSVGVAPELIWSLSDDIQTNIIGDIERRVGSAGIQLLNLSRKDVVKWKVKVLCALCTTTRQVPVRDRILAVPEQLQSEAPLRNGLTEEGAKTFDAGSFLSSIYHNWTDKKPHTKLDDEDKMRIQQLPWFETWRAGDYAVVHWKVKILCALCTRTREVPMIGRKLNVPEQLQSEAPLRNGLIEEEAKTFDAGKFLSHIYDNWTDKKPGTKLDDEDKARIEQLPWFGTWRAGDYAVVHWKVKVLCALCTTTREVPVSGRKLCVPEQLQIEAPLRKGLTEEGTKTFDTGSFLESIYHNWTDKKPGTKLNDEDKARIEKLPWFETWRTGDYAVTRWKVKVLCVLCTSTREVPQQQKKLSVPEQLQSEAPLRKGLTEEGARTFDAGNFLSRIRDNWTDKKPDTKLDDEDKLRIQQLPWFETWRAGDYAVTRWKVKVLCALCTTRQVPQQQNKLSVPAQLQSEAPLRSGLTEEGAKTFYAGNFLNRIRDNWTDKKPGTKLDDEDKLRIQQLPWFETWRAGDYAVTRWKVKVLCALCTTRQVPGRKKLSVPEQLQSEAPLRNGLTEENTKTFDAGSFLGCIYDNWTDKNPDTKLDDEDKLRIQQLPWFKTWRAGDYAVTRWKVKVLCALCTTTREVPSRTKLTVPEQLHSEAPLRKGLTEEGAKTFDAGSFLMNIYHNWTDKKPCTKLDDEDKMRIQQLPWFRAWRAGNYAVVRWKVRVLCALCTTREVPQQQNKLAVPEQLQSEAPLRSGLTEEGAKTFDAGSFLKHIYNNWTDKKPGTKLDVEDKMCIQQLPWFETWRVGDYVITRWKVKVLCALCTTREVPQQQNKLAVPEQLQSEAPLRNGLTEEGAKTFDAGSFLNHIYNNWTDKKPHTKLDDEDKMCIQQLPWFETWQSRRGQKRNPTQTIEPEKNKRRRFEEYTEEMQKLKDIGDDVDMDPLDGRLSREAAREIEARGYDPNTFTTVHRLWKDSVLEHFIEMMQSSSCKNALYLDHWAVDASDGRLRTTDALIESGLTSDSCFCANPDPDIVSALERRGVHATRSTFADALTGVWAEQTFDAIYADFCYGSSDSVCADLNLLFERRRSTTLPTIIAYTITRRGENMLHERLGHVNGFLRSKGYRWRHGDCAAEQMTFAPSGVVTTFFVLQMENAL